MMDGEQAPLWSGVNLVKEGFGMAHIEGDIVIDRTVDEVFDFVADERNEPLYNRRMIRVQKLSAGPIGLGMRFSAEMSQRRGTAEMTIECTAYERPRRLSTTTHLSNMEIDGTLLFEPVPEGTRMRWLWDVKPRGLLRLMGPMIARIGRRQERTIWAGLKRVLEAKEDSVSSSTDDQPL